MGDAESGMALRGWKRRQEGKTLYITARKVPVSPSFREGVLLDRGGGGGGGLGRGPSRRMRQPRLGKEGRE